MSRPFLRFGAVAATAAAALLVSAVPASAHVTALPGELYAGSYATVTFRVPNESDTAGTHKLVLRFPTTAQFNFAFVQPHPDWSHRIDRSSPEVGVGVHTVTWRAELRAERILPGEFSEFKILAGPFPEGQVCFKAAQHYDDGTVVDWATVPTPGDPHPAHPAPCVNVIPRPAAGVVAAAVDKGAEADATRVTLVSSAQGPGGDAPMVMVGLAAVALIGSGVLAGRVTMRRRAERS